MHFKIFIPVGPHLYTGTLPSSMGQWKKDVTPLLTQWSYVFLALTHRADVSPYWPLAATPGEDMGVPSEFVKMTCLPIQVQPNVALVLSGNCSRWRWVYARCGVGLSTETSCGAVTSWKVSTIGWSALGMLSCDLSFGTVTVSHLKIQGTRRKDLEVLHL